VSRTATPDPGAPARASADGTVVGWSDGVAAAEGFAASQGRRLVVARGWDEAVRQVSSGPGSVTFSGGSSLSARHIHELTEAAVHAGTGLGFIAGWAGADGAAAHARKLAGYRWLETGSTLLWSDEPLPGWAGTHGGVEILDGRDPRLVTAVTRARSRTALTTHGNGVDAPLATALLCSVPDGGSGAADPGRPAPFLPCGHGPGACVWQDHIGAGRRFAERFDPRRIAADVLILHSCYGSLAAGSVYDPARSLVSRFAESADVGALLTTYRDASDETWPVLLSLALLDAGHSLGETCRLLNAATIGGGDGAAPWLLVGDPATRFRARRPMIDLIAGEVRRDELIPGMNLLRLPTDRPHVVHVRVAGPAADRVDVSVRQVPSSRLAVAVCLSPGATEVTLSATVAERDARTGVLRDIRRVVSPLSQAVSVVDRMEEDPRSRGLVDAAGLRDAVASRLRRHAALRRRSADYAIASDLSGTDQPTADDHKEIRSWVALNGALAHYLAAYAPAAPSVNTFGTGRGEAVATSDCGYCGMPATRRAVAPDLANGPRHITWCSGCGLVADTSDAVRDLRVSGPGSLVTGSTAEFVLRMEGLRPASWRVVHCGLRVQTVPWSVDYTAPMRVAFPAGDAAVSIPLEIEILNAVPPGVYSLMAVVAAQGDLWICRRPVWIGEGSASAGR
jgi:hypothetical protein